MKGTCRGLRDDAYENRHSARRVEKVCFQPPRARARQHPARRSRVRCRAPPREPNGFPESCHSHLSDPPSQSDGAAVRRASFLAIPQVFGGSRPWASIVGRAEARVASAFLGGSSKQGHLATSRPRALEVDTLRSTWGRSRRARSRSARARRPHRAPRAGPSSRCGARVCRHRARAAGRRGRQRVQ